MKKVRPLTLYQLKSKGSHARVYPIQGLGAIEKGIEPINFNKGITISTLRVDLCIGGKGSYTGNKGSISSIICE